MFYPPMSIDSTICSFSGLALTDVPGVSGDRTPSYQSVCRIVILGIQNELDS
jgi:hypothetical protein